MNKASIAALLMLAWPSGALAEDWYRISYSDTSVTYADVDSASRQGDEITAWEYKIWFRPTPTGMVRARTRLIMNCRNNSFRNLYHSTFGQGGSNASWESFNSTWRVVAPDTAVGRLINFFCVDRSQGTRLGAVSPEADARQYAR